MTNAEMYGLSGSNAIVEIEGDVHSVYDAPDFDPDLLNKDEKFPIDIDSEVDYAVDYEKLDDNVLGGFFPDLNKGGAVIESTAEAVNEEPFSEAYSTTLALIESVLKDKDFNEATVTVPLTGYGETKEYPISLGEFFSGPIYKQGLSSDEIKKLREQFLPIFNPHEQRYKAVGARAVARINYTPKLSGYDGLDAASRAAHDIDY